MAALDRETVLDLTVNVVPLAIIALFALVGLVVAPIGWGSLFTEVVELGLLAVPFVVLAVVTYLAGRAIMLDEERVEAEAEAEAEAATADEAAPGTEPRVHDATGEEETGEEEPAPGGHETGGGTEPRADEETDPSESEPAEPASRSDAEGEP